MSSLLSLVFGLYSPWGPTLVYAPLACSTPLTSHPVLGVRGYRPMVHVSGTYPSSTPPPPPATIPRHGTSHYHFVHFSSHPLYRTLAQEKNVSMEGSEHWLPNEMHCCSWTCKKYHIRTNDIVNIDYWHCPPCTYIVWPACIADGNLSECGLELLIGGGFKKGSVIILLLYWI
jgi:hypothetical protein